MKIFKLKNKGFTLVELIIVVAIIAILASVITPMYGRYVESARQSSDLQMATNIIKAMTTSIADPKSELPANYFVEVLWITGEESGANITRGSIMIRPPDGNRVSALSKTSGISPIPLNYDLTGFSESVFQTLGNEEEIYSDIPSLNWYQMTYNDADSELGNEANLALHINTTTGEVALASLTGTDANPNRWINVGLDVTPHPDFSIDE